MYPDAGASSWEYWDENQQVSEPEFLTIDEGWEVINETEKLLIFVAGTKTWIPHQVQPEYLFRDLSLAKCWVISFKLAVLDTFKAP